MALRALVSIVGLCAALVMCAVSAAMNYLFLSSLGKSALEGQVLGAASAAADVLKALLPFFIAWSWQAGRYVAATAGALAFAFIAGFSLLSAIGFAADNRGFLADKRDILRAAYERVQGDLQARERDRAGLPQARPPAVVAQEIEKYRQNRRWSATRDCVDATEAESRSYCSGYFSLRAELAAGQEAARLSFEIAALQAQAERLRQQGSGEENDPQVTLVSRISGFGEEPVRLALIVAVALLVEIGASLGLFLASGHSLAAREAAPGCDIPSGSIVYFCLTGLVPAKGRVVAEAALYESYRDWCQAEGCAALDAARFARDFADLAKSVGIACDASGYRGIAPAVERSALKAA